MENISLFEYKSYVQLLLNPTDEIVNQFNLTMDNYFGHDSKQSKIVRVFFNYINSLNANIGNGLDIENFPFREKNYINKFYKKFIKYKLFDLFIKEIQKYIKKVEKRISNIENYYLKKTNGLSKKNREKINKIKTSLSNFSTKFSILYANPRAINDAFYHIIHFFYFLNIGSNLCIIEKDDSLVEQEKQTKRDQIEFNFDAKIVYNFEIEGDKYVYFLRGKDLILFSISKNKIIGMLKGVEKIANISGNGIGVLHIRELIIGQSPYHIFFDFNNIIGNNSTLPSNLYDYFTNIKNHSGKGDNRSLGDIRISVFKTSNGSEFYIVSNIKYLGNNCYLLDSQVNFQNIFDGKKVVLGEFIEKIDHMGNSYMIFKNKTTGKYLLLSLSDGKILLEGKSKIKFIKNDEGSYFEYKDKFRLSKNRYNLN